MTAITGTGSRSGSGSGLGARIALMALLALSGLVALGLLASQAPQARQTFRVPQDQRVEVPSNLTIRPHAAKHNGEAERIYNLLLAGKCATTMKYCGGSEIENMYVCVDPVTGAVGAILQFGDEIMTGYFESDGSGYWIKRAVSENWEVCH